MVGAGISTSGLKGSNLKEGEWRGSMRGYDGGDRRNGGLV